MNTRKFFSFREDPDNSNNATNNNSHGKNPFDFFEKHSDGKQKNDAQMSESDGRIISTSTNGHDPLNEQVTAGSFAAATQVTVNNKPPTSSNSGSSGSDSNGSSKTSNSIFSLTRKKKQKPMPKIQSSGVVNYGGIGIGQNSDSESESVASTISNSSNPQAGYVLPFHIQSGYPNPKLTDDVDDDELSQRTPIPKAPPNPAINAILPSDFLRNRTNSETNLSDISEDDSIVKRQKREEQNVGRLVHAAKQQQSFAQAWFSAGQAQNALPPIPPKKKIPSNAPPGLKTKFDEKSSGPIDLDSGEVWEKDKDKKNVTIADVDDDIENHSKLNMEIGSFNFGTTHSAPTKKRANKKMTPFGVPEDEDLTTYYIPNRWMDRIVCTIGGMKCTLLAFLVIFFLLLVGAGISTGIIVAQQEKLVPSQEPSASPTLSHVPTLSLVPTTIPTTIPTAVPTAVPTMTPSFRPTSQPSSRPSLPPTGKPSAQPTEKPSAQPSSLPTLMPSFNPTDSPTLEASSQPSLSSSPSSAPSGQPSSCFSSILYELSGQQLKLENSTGGDEFGTSVSLSRDGNILAVSAAKVGSVQVHERNQDGQWQLKGQVIKNEVGFGTSLELSDDGLTLVVGKADLVDEDVTRVYRYDTVLGTWEQLGEDIVEPGSDIAGFSVAISGDGNVIAIGDHGYYYYAGRVRVYEFNNVGWINRGNPLDGSSTPDELGFGHSISLSQNGNVVACGGPEETVFERPFTGSVQVFKWNAGANDWIPLGRQLFGTTSSFDNFGYSVSISDDETNPRVAVGAPNANIDGFLESGSVTIWEYDGLDWNQVGPTIVGQPASSQLLGSAVSIAGDGTHVAMGEPNGGIFRTGKVLIYFWNGYMWDETKALRGAEGSEFGKSLDLSGDGTAVAIGAPARFGRGYAEVFESNGDCEYQE